jgi:hypothetical protein
MTTLLFTPMKPHFCRALLALLLLPLAAFVQEEPKLSRVKLNDHVSMMLPRDFKPMTDDQIAERYFTYRKPVAMYTNPEGDVDFGLNMTATQWKAEDLEILQRFYKSSINKMYTEVKFEREAIEQINGKKFIVFEFSAVVRPDKNESMQLKARSSYTHIQYTVHNEKVYVFNFTSPYLQRAKWKNTATEMMKTIKIGAI